jgi:hypothetical protein
MKKNNPIYLFLFILLSVISTTAHSQSPTKEQTIDFIQKFFNKNKEAYTFHFNDEFEWKRSSKINNFQIINFVTSANFKIDYEIHETID